MQRPSISRLNAFTLTEILLSFALVAVLAALLIGHVGRVQEQSRAVQCAGNLRQIGTAMLAYAHDHQNSFPPILNTQRTPPDTVAWMHKLRSYVNYTNRSMGSSPLPRASGIFYCPGMTEADRSGRRVGYFYNSRVTATRNYHLTRLSAGPLILMIEGAPQNVEAIAPNSAAPVARHAGVTHALYAQGHVVPLTTLPPVDAPEWGGDLVAPQN